MIHDAYELFDWYVFPSIILIAKNIDTCFVKSILPSVPPEASVNVKGDAQANLMIGLILKVSNHYTGFFFHWASP